MFEAAQDAVDHVAAPEPLVVFEPRIGVLEVQHALGRQFAGEVGAAAEKPGRAGRCLVVAGGQVLPDVREELLAVVHPLERALVEARMDVVAPRLVGRIVAATADLLHVVRLAGDVVVELADPGARVVLHHAGGFLPPVQDLGSLCGNAVAGRRRG
jgi:hypothetical protein